MSGFVATSQSPIAPGSAEDVIQNDGWFPDVTTVNVRASERLDGTVTHERLRNATLYAVSQVNRQLSAYKAAQLLLGRDSLAEVPADTIDGESRLVMLYHRAVHAHVQADVMERYRGYDTTASGEKRERELDPAVGEQLRNVTWAIRDILGLPHVTVELI